MKIFNDSMTRRTRAARFGAVLGTALFAACTLQAQYTGPVPQPLQPPPGAQTPIPATPDMVSHAGKEFMQFAAQANQTEIASANIAGNRSQNTTVKQLAQMMRTDHQQNYDLLQVMAQNHLVALDSSLNAMNQRSVNRLKKASNADFDKDYTKLMLKDHVKCIGRFDKATKDLEEPYLREYAQGTLPALRNHLQHSEEAARAVGVDESTISAILKGLPSHESQQSVAANLK